MSSKVACSLATLSRAGLESPRSIQVMSNAVWPPRRQFGHWAPSLSEPWKAFHLFLSQVFVSFRKYCSSAPFSCRQQWESWRCPLLWSLEVELEWRECAFKRIYFECICTGVGRGWLNHDTCQLFARARHPENEALGDWALGWEQRLKEPRKYLYDMVPGWPLKATVLGSWRGSLRDTAGFLSVCCIADLE